MSRKGHTKQILFEPFYAVLNAGKWLLIKQLNSRSCNGWVLPSLHGHFCCRCSATSPHKSVYCSLSHQTKSFSMSWYKCSVSLSEEVESLSSWWKCPSSPPVIYLWEAFFPCGCRITSRCEHSWQKMTPSPCHPIELPLHVVPGNPRRPSTGSTFCLTAGCDEPQIRPHEDFCFIHRCILRLHCFLIWIRDYINWWEKSSVVLNAIGHRFPTTGPHTSTGS